MGNVKFNEYNWSQARVLIAKADAEFTRIVDEWNPGKEYTFIELSYPFGSHILDIYKGGFQIPMEEGKTLPLTNTPIFSELQKKLGYSALPLGLIVSERGVEVYHKLQNNIFSLAFFTTGLNLGVWEIFGPPAPYSVVSGARSLIIAPKISDTDNHKKLKELYGLRQSVPRHLCDQWSVFVELGKYVKEPWEVKILFLNQKWLEPKKRNIGWLNFYNYLCRKAWGHTEYARSKSVFEVSWKNFCAILQEKGERFDPYIIESVRHIVFVGQSILPAFAALGDSEIHCPAQYLRQVYADQYGLKHYVPTLLGPVHYERTFKKPVPLYYSFQNPTLLDSIPKNTISSSAIDDMRNFKALMEYFIEENMYGDIKFGNSSIREMLSGIDFEYFHSEMYTYGGIKSSAKLPEDDPNLLYMSGKDTTRQFAYKGSFFRCCVRIFPKNRL